MVVLRSERKDLQPCTAGKCTALASAKVWVPLPQLLYCYCTVLMPHFCTEVTPPPPLLLHVYVQVYVQDLIQANGVKQCISLPYTSLLH